MVKAWPQDPSKNLHDTVLVSPGPLEKDPAMSFTAIGHPGIEGCNSITVYCIILYDVMLCYVMLCYVMSSFHISISTVLYFYI